MKAVASLLAGLTEGGMDRDAPSWRALEEVVVLARAEGIAIALIVMPEGSRLRRSYPERSWERIWTSLETLSDRYHCSLINAREWVDSEYFADPDHLGAAGARLFTERLGREHLRALLLQPTLVVQQADARRPCLP